MLLHSKTLYNLYPEQLWLDSLQQEKIRKSAYDISAAPKFRKQSSTFYRLRQLQTEKKLSAFDHFLKIFRSKKAA